MPMIQMQALQSKWRVLSALALCTVCTSGCAFGPSWNEQVTLLDGSKVIVKRQTIVGSRFDRVVQDIRLPPPTRGNILYVPLLNEGWTSKWETMGLHPLAIDLVDGSWFLAAIPMLCEDYGKWGRPTPPYVFFKYFNETWERIPVDQFPSVIVRRNLTIGSHEQRYVGRSGYVSADHGRGLNPVFPKHINNIIRSGAVYEWDDCRARLEVIDRNRARDEAKRATRNRKAAPPSSGP
jgi:hypothetical protein